MLLVYTDTSRVSGGLAGPLLLSGQLGRAPKHHCRVYWFLVKGPAVLLVRGAVHRDTGTVECAEDATDVILLVWVHVGFFLRGMKLVVFCVFTCFFREGKTGACHCIIRQPVQLSDIITAREIQNCFFTHSSDISEKLTAIHSESALYVYRPHILQIPNHMLRNYLLCTVL